MIQKNVTLYKEGQEPVSPYACEVTAYEANGWSQSKPEQKSEVKTDKSEPKLKPKPTNTKKEA